MSRCTMIGCGLVLAGVFVVSVGCPSHPPAIRPPAINAAQAGAKAIEMYDTNKDGKLSGEELDKCPGLKAALGAIDPSGEGVTADMIAARIQAWKNMQTGRLPPVGCMVTHNGVPLEGAEVKLVPEKFLGDIMQVATGKTDKHGSASISIPTSGDKYDPRGVPPGFYRVEITKPGLDIPAKYNTETTLGREVVYGPTMLENIRVDLKF